MAKNLLKTKFLYNRLFLIIIQKNILSCAIFILGHIGYKQSDLHIINSL